MILGQLESVISKLNKFYPDAHCALDHKNSFELLVATILSAQCTDERVNKVTPNLFEKFPNPKEMSKAKPNEIEKLIHSTGFFKNKSKNLIQMSKLLVQEFDGEVPKDMDSLTSLAGVGRKTANVVLGNAFGIASGIVVDTHVSRLSNRLGWTEKKDPVKIELELNSKVAKKHWIKISHLLITHGRNICTARKPKCSECFLVDLCPRQGVE